MKDDTEKIRRVLVVEDDPAAREATGMYLEHFGYEVATAASAEAAIAAADSCTPNLLICDWQLGRGESGVTVARELQERYDVSVIFMTAHPLDELYEETEDLRVYHYLKKPLSLRKLARAVGDIRI